MAKSTRSTREVNDPNVAPPDISVDDLNVADPDLPDPNAPTPYPRPDPETEDPRTGTIDPPAEMVKSLPKKPAEQSKKEDPKRNPEPGDTLVHPKT